MVGKSVNAKTSKANNTTMPEIICVLQPEPGSLEDPGAGVGVTGVSASGVWVGHR